MGKKKSVLIPLKLIEEGINFLKYLFLIWITDK